MLLGGNKMFKNIKALIVRPYSYMLEVQDDPRMGLAFWLFYLAGFFLIFNQIYPVKSGLSNLDYLPGEIYGAVIYLQQANILEVIGVAAVLALACLIFWVLTGLVVHLSMKLVGSKEKFSVSLIVLGLASLPSLVKGLVELGYLKVFDQVLAYKTTGLGSFMQAVDGFYIWTLILFVLGLWAFYPKVTKVKRGIMIGIWTLLILGISLAGLVTGSGMGGGL